MIYLPPWPSRPSLSPPQYMTVLHSPCMTVKDSLCIGWHVPFTKRWST
jgi:hypothetical protein